MGGGGREDTKASNKTDQQKGLIRSIGGGGSSSFGQSGSFAGRKQLQGRDGCGVCVRVIGVPSCDGAGSDWVLLGAENRDRLCVTKHLLISKPSSLCYSPRSPPPSHPRTLAPPPPPRPLSVHPPPPTASTCYFVEALSLFRRPCFCFLSFLTPLSLFKPVTYSP